MESISTPNLTEAQTKTLEELQKKAEAELKSTCPQLLSSLSFYTNIDNLLRFFIARELKADPAFLMWKSWVNWHSTYQPHKISETEECVAKNMTSNKLVWHKHDKLKRPCLYYRMKYHQSGLSGKHIQGNKCEHNV